MGQVKDEIRQAVASAALVEESIGPFQLSGRGHEPRVTLDRSLATILRGQSVPRVHISGYGAGYHYPLRIFVRAIAALDMKLGRSPIAMLEDPPTVYFSEKDN